MNYFITNDQLNNNELKKKYIFFFHHFKLNKAEFENISYPYTYLNANIRKKDFCEY